MHELPITQRILSTVLKHAVANDVKKIMAIHLQIGKLSDLADEWIQSYFDYLSKGTLAENAQLKIERIPLRVQCHDCSRCFEVELDPSKKVLCPDCGGSSHKMVSGREYYIKAMEAF